MIDDKGCCCHLGRVVIETGDARHGRCHQHRQCSLVGCRPEGFCGGVVVC